MSVENQERRDLTEYHRPQTDVADKWAALLVSSGWPCVCSVMSDSLRPLPGSLSMEFSGQEYWSGLPFPAAGDLLDPGIKMASPALASGFFITSVTWKAPWTPLGGPQKHQPQESTLDTLRSPVKCHKWTPTPPSHQAGGQSPSHFP